MLYRLLPIFALIFLFGIGQQGAVTHAVSHLADLQQQDDQDGKSNHAPACDKCVTYAELGSAVGSSVPAPLVLAQGFLPYVAGVAITRSALYQPYSARAPPRLT